MTRRYILPFLLWVGFVCGTHAQSFTSSNLPIVIINTNGQGIPNDPKIIADMGIIDNGPGRLNRVTDPQNNYNGKIGIETRGSSSQMFPKKSYGLETRSSSNTNDNRNVSLLGLPVENDWILYAPYTEKTMIRDVLSYHIARRMGWYASRFRYCELVLNGNYQGVYVLLEKIKRDANRVNISELKPEDNAGDQLTGGYIVKVDRANPATEATFVSRQRPLGSRAGLNITFVVAEPERHVPARPDDITPAQLSYIQNYVHTFEAALAGNDFADPDRGYRRYINASSFVDYFLLTETVFNIDGYRLSTFLYKDRDSKGGRLVAGPPWDYNLTMGNADYCGGERTDRWAYNFNYVCGQDGFQVPFWWERLLQDRVFANDVKCRWLNLRKGILHTDSLTRFIDSVANVLQEPQQRNYQRWPILNQYVWPNAKVTGSYTGELDYLKSWLQARLLWLDANMQGSCDVLAAENPYAKVLARVYPNPAAGRTVYADFDNLPGGTPVAADVYDRLGRKVAAQSWTWRNEPNALPVDNLPAGVYIVRFHAQGRPLGTQKLVK
ncbi:MAG: CotH kinase family protein [Cytophagales bacterium]|jgi:hypothetical protein|nr:CotH kinase family protein [Cytophagales bacterium]